jgi:uncharacterized phage-associated protein
MRADMVKINSFDYLLVKLINWHEHSNSNRPSFEKSEFTKLKAIKLHFFTCAASVGLEPNPHNDLLSIFDKFCAMPYGHVESDVYNFVNDDLLISFNVRGNYFYPKRPISESQSHDLLTKEKIDMALSTLQFYNPDIINYSAMQLVELSHQWYSWQTAFNLAKSQKKQSMQIPTSIIRTENKIFSLLR